MPPDPGSTTGSRHRADLTTEFGLSKEEIRRIVLDKLRVVYHDWHVSEVPFVDFQWDAGERREDPSAFVIARGSAAQVTGASPVFCCLACDTVTAQCPPPRRKAFF